MVRAMLVLALLAGPHAVRAATVDTDTLQLVQTFLKLPTEQLPPEHIPAFLAVDPESLPAKLRRPFAAKRLELYTLKQLADGKKRGSVRMPEANCALPKAAEVAALGIMSFSGFEAITEDEERWLMEKTQCTERDLMCEFTLQVLIERKGRPQRPRRKLFLHARDPLMALLAQYRSRRSMRQTNFFGIGTTPTCAPRLK